MVTFDDSRFPLVIIAWSDDVQESDISVLIERTEAMTDRAIKENVRFASVINGGASFSAAMRERINQWVSSVPAERQERNLAAFVVTHNPLVRGALTALRWMNARGLERTHASSSSADAEQRAIAVLSAAGFWKETARAG